MTRPTGAPPTEAEIREHVAGQFADNGTLNSRGVLGDALFQAAHVLVELYDLDELRGSETEALIQAELDAVAPILDRVVVELQDAVVAAGLRFAARHPDAPRAASLSDDVPRGTP